MPTITRCPQGCFRLDGQSLDCDHVRGGMTTSKKYECPRRDCPSTWPDSVEACSAKPCPMRGENYDRKPAKTASDDEPVLYLRDPTPQELGAEVNRRMNEHWAQRVRSVEQQNFTWAFMRHLKADLMKHGSMTPLQYLGDHLPEDLRYWPIIR